MIQVTDRNAVHEFFHDRLGLHWSHDFRGVIHVPDELSRQVMRMDDVAIAVGYNAFIGRTCCMHTVIQRPDLLSRSVLREAFEYPFLVCNCEAVLGLVDSKNDAAIRFNSKLGFCEIARVPNGGPDADLIVMQMLRSDCRWLRKPH